MLKLVLDNFLKPALGRSGTIIGTVLVGYGMQSDQATMVGSAAVALALFGVDLVSDWFGRKQVANRTFNATVSTMLHGEARQ